MFICNQVDATTHTLAKYLMELTIVEYDLAQFNPSQIAAASLCLAMKLICDIPEWVSLLLHTELFLLLSLLLKVLLVALHLSVPGLPLVSGKCQESLVREFFIANFVFGTSRHLHALLQWFPKFFFAHASFSSYSSMSFTPFQDSLTETMHSK